MEKCNEHELGNVAHYLVGGVVGKTKLTQSWNNIKQLRGRGIFRLGRGEYF